MPKQLSRLTFLSFGLCCAILLGQCQQVQCRVGSLTRTVGLASKLVGGGSTAPAPVENGENESLFASGSKAIISATGHAAVASYGLGLLVFSRRYAGQIHFFTMMRASGFNKLEAAVRKLKRNLRDAVLTVIWNSPSFLMARRSVKSLRDHIRNTRQILAETRRAKADGVITSREARRLDNLRRDELNKCRRDLRRILRAGASFGQVWQAIDLDEIRDVLRGFVFQLMAVLASGHNEKWVAALVSRWCLFLNLGSHALDVNQKLKYPIARWLMRSRIKTIGGDAERADLIESTAEKVVFCGAGVLVAKTYNSTALDLNAALVSSSIAYRGLRGFLKSLCWREEWSGFYRTLDGPIGGVVMIGLTTVGFLCRRRQGEATFLITGSFDGVPWYRAPFRVIELTLDRMVHTMDRVL